MATGTTEIQPDLANFWWYEHLLSLPDVDTEIVTHFGDRFRQLPAGSMPASAAARLFLRHLRLHPMTDMEELLGCMVYFRDLSEKPQQFRTPAAATAMNPPVDLIVEVLEQHMTNQCVKWFQHGQNLADISAGIEQQIQQLLQQLGLDQVSGSTQLKQSLDVFQYVLSSKLVPETASQLQTQLQNAFPKHLMQHHLQAFTTAAWEALGPSSLQLFQQAVLSGQMPMHHFMAFLHENEQLDNEQEHQAAAEDTAAVPVAAAETPAEHHIIIGGQQQEVVIPDSTDAAVGALRGEQQPSPTPVVPSPRTGSDGAGAAAAAASGKHQRRAADPAAAALRQQLDLQLSTAAGTSRVRQQQQQQQPAENHPLSAVLPGLAARAAAASGAGNSALVSRQPMQLIPPGPCVLTWGADRRGTKTGKKRAGVQQRAEERAAKRAADEQLREEQRQLKAKQKAEKEAARKAAEAQKRAAAKKERARLRAERERLREVERELAKQRKAAERAEKRAERQAEKEQQKKERAEARKAARAAGKKVDSESEEDVEMLSLSSEEEEEFHSLSCQTSSDDWDSNDDSDGWTDMSEVTDGFDDDDDDDDAAKTSKGKRKRRAAAARQKRAAAAAAGGGDAEENDFRQPAAAPAAAAHPRVRHRQGAKGAAAGETSDVGLDGDDDDDGIFADLQDISEQQPAAAAAAEGTRKRKPDTPTRDAAAAAAAAAQGEKRRRQDLPAADARKEGGAADGSGRQLCGRGGEQRRKPGRTVQWHSSVSEPDGDHLEDSPGVCKPQTAAEMRAALAAARAASGKGLAEGMRDRLEAIAQVERAKAAAEAAAASTHGGPAAGQKQTGLADTDQGAAALDGSGGNLYDYVVSGVNRDREDKVGGKSPGTDAAAAGSSHAAALAAPAAASSAGGRQGADGISPAAGQASKVPGGERQGGAGNIGRRKTQRWSSEEEKLLIDLVKRWGVGSWAKIREAGGEGFLLHRTAVDLKDKWRNIMKNRMPM